MVNIKIKGRQLALEIMRISNEPLSPEEMLDKARKMGFYKYYTPGTDEKQKLASFGAMLYTWNDRGYLPKLKTYGDYPTRFSLNDKDKKKIESLVIGNYSSTKTIKGVEETIENNNGRIKDLQFGELINFRGLIHAPINEQGVVYLFGMLSYELGFIIESIRTGYPDCEGKRRIREDKWKKVTIEFEYASSNFKDHGHDSSKCDVIVCWKNDWENCPIEVIELKSIIEDKKK